MQSGSRCPSAVLCHRSCILASTCPQPPRPYSLPWGHHSPGCSQHSSPVPVPWQGFAVVLCPTESGSPRNELTLLTPLCTPQVHPRCLLPKGHGHHCGRVSTWWGLWLGFGQNGDTAHRGATVPPVAAGKLCGMAQPCAPSLPSPQHPCLLQEWQCERPHPQADEDLGL